MTVSEVLREIARENHTQEVWDALYRELRKLCGRPFSPSRSGTSFFIPEGDREDIVQDVAAKVLECSPLPVVGKSEGECTRYLAMMLRNQWLTQRRRRSREELSNEPIGPEVRQEEPAPEGPGLAELRELLERVYRELHSRRAPRFRAELARTWAQVRGIAFEGSTMDDILRRDEGVTANTPPAERKKAQQRIHQGHSRLRSHLTHMADEMEREGRLSASDAHLARRIIEGLNRCQPPAVPRVSADGSNPEPGGAGHA